jgi:hypothetical protein
MVMPRAFSSGALSISSKDRACPPNFSERTYVTDGADIDVRLVPRELLLRHFLFAPILKSVLRRTRADYRVYAGTGTPVRPSTTFSAMLGGTSSYLSNCIV